MHWWKPNIEEEEYRLTASELQVLQQSLADSPYLRPNVLNHRFASTQGFSLLFADRTLLPPSFHFLAPFLQHLDPRCNYFYLNVLQLSTAAKVDRHIDHSVRGYSDRLPFPRRVSVLYLQADHVEGGHLLFYNSRDEVMREVVPATGKWVSFVGHLKHAITPVLNCAQPRLSLVCEQYALRKSHLAYLPAFTLKSTASFDTFLAEALPDNEANTL